MATQTAREIRLALCGPDIFSRRQASCIPHIGAAREGGNNQGGLLERGEEEGQREEGKVRNGKGARERIQCEPAVSFLGAI